MKLTDGMFQRVFTDVAKLYPNIKTEHRIVDIATAQVASKPASYDVIVTLNLYGDIISDVAAEVGYCAHRRGRHVRCLFCCAPPPLVFALTTTHTDPLPRWPVAWASAARPTLV